MNHGPVRVGSVPLRALADGAMVRLEYPPFHVLVSLVDGIPCAIEDGCNHAGASLSEGERRGCLVECPMHGYLFDLGTGQLIAPPGLCGDQRTFEIRLVGEDVEVWDPGLRVPIFGL